MTFKLLRLARLFRAGDWVCLINFQSLQHLTVINARYTLGVGKPSKQSLDSLHFSNGKLKTPILALVGTRGLKSLVVFNLNQEEKPEWTAKDVTVAIGGHSESLTFLAFDDCDIFQTDHKRRLRDCFLDNTGRCKGLSRLAMPLFYEASLLDEWKALLKILPNLVALVIFDYPQGPANNKDAASRFANCLMNRIQTSSKFILLAINFSNRQGVPLDCDESASRCFCAVDERTSSEDLSWRAEEDKGNSSRICSVAPTL